MDRIEFADGTELADGSIVMTGEKQIMVSVPGTDLANAVLMLCDADKTSEMVCYYGVFRRVYRGYTQVGSAATDRIGNRVRVYLNGEDVSFEERYVVPERYLPEKMRTKKTEGETSDEHTGGEA